MFTTVIPVITTITTFQSIFLHSRRLHFAVKNPFQFDDRVRHFLGQQRRPKVSLLSLEPVEETIEDIVARVFSQRSLNATKVETRVLFQQMTR